MADRAGELPQKLFSAYLGKNPDIPTRLLYNDVQTKELQRSLGRVDADPTVKLDNGIEIGSSSADTTGRKLVIISNPKLRTHELLVVAPRQNNLPPEIAEHPQALKDITEPYGPKAGPYNPHMMRLIMISMGNLVEGNYKGIAESTQAGEKLPQLGLWPKGGIVSGALSALRLAAVYEIKPEEPSKYIVTVEKPGQETVSETWVELAKKFSYGSDSFMVLGRAANVGRVPTKY